METNRKKMPKTIIILTAAKCNIACELLFAAKVRKIIENSLLVHT